MNNLQRIILLIIALCLALPSWAAEPRQQPTDQERARTLYIFHQPMVMLQAKFGLTTPEERVLRVRNTLRNFTQADISQPLQVVPISRYNQHGRLFIMNGKPLMLLTEGDLDEGDDLTLDQATQRVLARMEAQRTALLQQYDTSYLAMSVVKTLAGGTVLVLFWYGAYKAWRRLRRYYHRKHLAKVSTTPHNLRRFISTLETKLSLLITVLAGIVAFYIWLSWSFSLYPWTRVWGESLGEWLVSMFQQIVVAIISSLPGMVIVVVIFLITSFIIKLLKALLKQVELGSVSIPGLHPETVGTTRKLISAMVWLFALSAAYPFLPGANSLAFKGISVFFGLMLTLGSAGVMNHAMSGLVLIYSRALRKGDVIRIADNEGLVSEIGMLATKIITRENYVVTLPNAVVVSGKITNLSANNSGGAINLTTSVTIGYDTPWRQVQAMLELAARRTSVVEQQTPPLVRQLELMDWYVAYELQVRLVQGTPLAAARNELHSHIQDVFNEFNVQIMSPHFVLQPDNNVVVPQEGWYPAPATPPDGKPQ